MPVEKSENYSFLVPTKPKGVFWGDLDEDISWKSPSRNVVKYDVYLDILLVRSVCVTASVFVEETQLIPVILQPPSSRLRHRYERW